MTRYKNTLEAKQRQNGFGLNEAEIASNMTLDEKVNKMCPEFDRMDGLFREKPNITPASTRAWPSAWSKTKWRSSNRDSGRRRCWRGKQS
ncbi:hypothetical protein PHMEG_00011632 [Phytophthora megakarya]|uniref:Uncharacterized protein n=1 Tax=Phytophthora megakarya TaxID=4795 RepID=A0A225WC56_9STRA|nr:hypothetical protein PHMEG_00011632 [Phytophthora megakarya]